jgi:predicted dinucleotide-binding enzyme
MTYAIIGSGNVGTALAGHFARNGIAFGIANSRGPGSLAELAKVLGPNVTPLTLEDALEADVIILAVLFSAHKTVAKALSNWSGKTVVDAMNPYGVAPEELNGQPSTDVVASAFPGAKVVKTLNQLPAKLLAQDPAVNDGRRVMFVSSNDEGAEASVGKLVADLGFAPILLGKVSEGGRLIGMGQALVLQNLIKHG